MKKEISFFTALIFFATAVSCSGDSVPKQSYIAEKMSVASYKKERVQLPAEMRQVYGFMPYNGGGNCLLIGTGARTPEFWRTNADFTEFETIEFPEFDIGVSYDIDTADNGTVVTFVTHADYGDLPPIGLYEYPEGYDEETYDNAAEYSFMIKTYSMDGELLNAAEVGDFGVVPDKSVSLNGLYSDGELVIVEINGTYEMFDISGKYLGELTSDNGDIDCIGHNNSGGLICAVSYEENDVDKLIFRNIGKNGSLTDSDNAVYELSETVYQILPGTDGYSLFIITNTSIYGIKSDTAEINALFNISVSGVPSNSVKGFYLTGDGQPAVLSNDSTNVNLKKFTPRSEEETANIPVLTLGMYGEHMFMTDYINAWNDSGNDFMIDTKVYSGEYEEQSAVFDEISQDALAGELPDLLLLYNDCLGEIDLVKMNAVCDLYEFIDKEEVYGREYFVPNVLECFENEGKLVALPDRFSIELGTVGKTKFLGKAEDWSFEKMVDMVRDPPIELDNENDSKYDRLYNGHVDWLNWVDFEKGTCNFKDELFYRYLNWCNEPADIETEFVYEPSEELTDEMREKEFSDQQREFLDDRELFSVEGLMTYANYVDMTRGQFGGEELTYIETPVLFGGDDMLGISANSENKELAWEFIKSRFTDEYYSSFFIEGSSTAPFPITKTGLKMYENWERSHYPDFSLQDDFKDDPEWRDYKGLIYPLSFLDSKKSVKLGEITDEDVSEVNAFIANARPKEKEFYPESRFYEIGQEEIERFFKGGCTAEECADAMQSRLEIYLSEHFG